MKKICSIVLLVIMTLSMFSFHAIADENKKIEIEFCVGDDTLMINGNPVKVEKPYVVDGVTLVPLRVITEAFGAKVDWDASTKTVTLTYPDVNIVLQIGNPIAELNGSAQTLLCAPQLTPSGFTFVPLRFISENFGATVSYDDATKRIKVIKDVSDDSLSMVEGIVENKYIGDSFYGWSMENFRDMNMDYREFDGTYTSFCDSENNYIEIYVDTVGDELDFDKEFLDEKDSFSDLTLVKANKDTSDENKKTMHFQAKNKDTFVEERIIIKGDYSYVIIGYFNAKNETIKTEGSRIIGTFDTTFAGDDIYDLSNVKNCVRRFESEEAKLSFDVPQDYIIVSDTDLENEFEFVSIKKDDNISRIHVSFYSKDNAGSALEMATEDFNHNKSYINEDIVKFSLNVNPRLYNGREAYEYYYEINATNYSEYTRDIFFEVGDYVYNVGITLKLPYPSYNAFIESFINSMKVEEIDINKMGSLLRNINDREGTYTSDENPNFDITLPNNYKEVSLGQGNMSYVNELSGVVIQLQIITQKNNFKASEVEDAVDEMEGIVYSTKGVKLIEKTNRVLYGTKRFWKFIAKNTINEDYVVFEEFYVFPKQNKLYAFTVTYSELAYSKAAKQEISDILTSIKFK